MVQGTRIWTTNVAPRNVKETTRPFQVQLSLKKLQINEDESPSKPQTPATNLISAGS